MVYLFSRCKMFELTGIKFVPQPTKPSRACCVSHKSCLPAVLQSYACSSLSTTCTNWKQFWVSLMFHWQWLTKLFLSHCGSGCLKKQLRLRSSGSWHHEAQDRRACLRVSSIAPPSLQHCAVKSEHLHQALRGASGPPVAFIQAGTVCWWEPLNVQDQTLRFPDKTDLKKGSTQAELNRIWNNR